MGFEEALKPILYRPRQPMDERLPNGQSVYDLMGAMQSPDKDRTTRKSQIMMLPGRGYEEIPYDPDHPDEGPTQTRRRLEVNAINRDSQGDPLQRAAAIRDEFGDPTAAQFPVSAATKTPLYGQGNGAEYNKSPLDPGYVAPRGLTAALNVPQSKFPAPLTQDGGQPVQPTGPTDIQTSNLSKVGSPPPEMTWDPITRDSHGKPSVSPTATGNRSDILNKQYEATQSWEPKPHGNRLVAALKSARDAIRLNARPSMSVGEVVGTAAGGAGVGLATRNPDLYAKEVEQRKALGDLSGALGVEKERAQVANMGMIPVTLNDGRVVMVPRAKAADLEDKQQTHALNQSKAADTAKQNKAHRDRWAAMGRKERKAQITNEYKAGMLTTPEQLADAADELEIPGELKPAFIRGQMRDAIDKDGNIIEVNRQTKTSSVVTDSTGKPVQSYEVTKQVKQDQRQAAREAAATTRTQMNIDGRLQAAREGIKAQADRMGDPDVMDDWAKQYKEDAKAKRSAAARIQVKTQADLNQQRQLNKDAADLEKAARGVGIQANKARSGQQGATPALKGRTMSQQNFDRYKKDHGDAAAQELLNGGVTIRN